MKSLLKNTGLALLTAGVLFGTGCAERPAEQPPETETAQVEAAPLKAVATLSPTEGNQASGTVAFAQGAGSVEVGVAFSGLSEGLHGFHIHETGDCSAPDGSSAGGHFNPTGSPHGGPDSPEHHAGDLGNIEAIDGKAIYTITSNMITLNEGANNIIGRAVIVHSQEDDFVTQPTGNAGARLACGIIVMEP